jgi:glycosyltransferase involved in cell wall biosynthesis
MMFRPDIVYVVDTAYTGVLAARLAKAFTGCQWITDTGDVAHELAKSIGTYSRFQLRLIQWIEQMALRHSDAVVVRGSYHKPLLEEKGVRQVVFIPDGVDMEVAKPVDSIALRSQLGISDSLVIGLTGSMSWSQRYRMCYGWDVVEAMGLLKDAPVKALLVGDGNGRLMLEDRARQIGVLNRIVFVGRVPHQQVWDYFDDGCLCLYTVK